MTDLVSEFIREYPGTSDVRTVFCPYRICPLGAHIDHQHGKVLGMAINEGIHIVYSPREDGNIKIFSLNYSTKAEFNINTVPERQYDWADHLRGTVLALQRNYKPEIGINVIIHGSLQVGGLSSSAAVIITFLCAICDINGVRLTQQELIDTAWLSETAYIGVNIGSLDQSCEVLSQKNKLLYLDTRDGSYKLVETPHNMPKYDIMIVCSGVERTLAGSKYNLRVDETKSAAYALMAYAGMDYGDFNSARLRDVPPDVYKQYKERLPEPWRRRAEHYYTEFRRVEDGAVAWSRGDLNTFGRLCSESGYSSIYNYEAGSEELQTLYDIMQRTDGIYGGRFSGAGFKGCCMGLTDPLCRDEIKSSLTGEYLKRFPALADKFSVHFCESADGVKL